MIRGFRASSVRRLAAGAAFVALVALAGPAQANRARRAGLAGNLGIADDTDLYLFPGEIAFWATRVDLDVAPRVTGAMLFGEPVSPVAFGVALNRDQSLNNLDGVDDLALFSRIHGNALGTLPISEVGTVLVGLRSGLGLRLSLTHGSEGRTFETADGEQENSTTVTGVEASVGWSLKDDATLFDTVATIRTNDLTLKEGEETPFKSTAAPSFSLGARGIFNANDSLAWVALANFSLRDHSGETRVQDIETGDFDTLERAAKSTVVRAGFGPQLRVGDWITVASVASFGYGKVSTDQEPALDLDTTSTAIAIPGFDTAVEARVSRYVDLRWGFRSRYLIEDDEAQDESKETQTDRTTAFRSTGEFSWNAGLGINYWDFDWDVEFSQLFEDESRVTVSLSWSPPADTFRRAPPPLPRPSPFDQEPAAPVPAPAPAATLPPPPPAP
jgi:hypothetical protein